MPKVRGHYRKIRYPSGGIKRRKLIKTHRRKKPARRKTSSKKIRR